MHLVIIALTAFLASAVEAIEAATIVLAIGYASGWRTALAGAAWACAGLALIVGVGGPAILSLVPIRIIRVAVGAFLLWFGYGWLRKAVLRYAGRIPMRDERAAFERKMAVFRNAGAQRTAFVAAFNGVFLEGLEVAIIVVSFGANSSIALTAAACGAVAAFLIVALVAVAMLGPIANIPENAMKFAVGVMVVSFGTFWLGEGVGIAWPFGNAMLPALAACYAGLAALCSVALRERTKRLHDTPK